MTDSKEKKSEVEEAVLQKIKEELESVPMVLLRWWYMEERLHNWIRIRRSDYTDQTYWRF